MALTLAGYRNTVDHAVGAIEGIYTDDNTTKDQIINDAGQYMLGMHPWQFLKHTTAYLDFTAPITITDGTWTEATKTLTKTAAFASYTYADGDTIKISDGTGATAATYTIASRTSDNAIVLVTSIGAGADGQTDIDGEIEFGYIALPSDFVEMTGNPVANDALNWTVEMSTLQQINSWRAITPTFTNHYFMALSWPVQTSGSPPTTLQGNPRMELYPEPRAASTGAILISYRRGWTTLSGATAVPNIPDYMEMLLQRVITAYVKEHEDDREDTLNNLEQSALLKNLKERDARTQWNFGYMKHGGAVVHHHLAVVPHSQIGNPS